MIAILSESYDNLERGRQSICSVLLYIWLDLIQKYRNRFIRATRTGPCDTNAGKWKCNSAFTDTSFLAINMSFRFGHMCHSDVKDGQLSARSSAIMNSGLNSSSDSQCLRPNKVTRIMFDLHQSCARFMWRRSLLVCLLLWFDDLMANSPLNCLWCNRVRVFRIIATDRHLR